MRHKHTRKANRLCTRKIDVRDGLDRLRDLVGCSEQRHVPAERALVT